MRPGEGANAAFPVRVAADGESKTAVFIAPGTRFWFPPDGWPFEGEHPWKSVVRGPATESSSCIARAKRTRSGTSGKGRSGDSRGWYVNLQASFDRDGQEFDTNDHELDLVIEPMTVSALVRLAPVFDTYAALDPERPPREPRRSRCIG